jgi:hypothetical protein
MESGMEVLYLECFLPVVSVLSVNGQFEVVLASFAMIKSLE